MTPDEHVERRARAPECMGCCLPYDDPGFADLVVPNDVWARISPAGHEGGLLCPTCMVRAAAKAGLAGVQATFRSGPFVIAASDAAAGYVLEAQRKAVDAGNGEGSP